MAYSYDEMQGTPQNPDDHESDTGHNRDQYAGDVVSMPGSPKGPGAGPTLDAVDYATGRAQDPKIKSIGNDTLRSWHTNRSNR